jgi:RNA-directed DNA polymerase
MATPALADKLDTVEVNGPQDDDFDWDAVYWRPVEEDVRRLRQRIFKASQEGDLKRVADSTCRRNDAVCGVWCGQ